MLIYHKFHASSHCFPLFNIFTATKSDFASVYIHLNRDIMSITNEPRREKTGLRGFRPGPTQTGLYKLRKELEA